MSRVVLSVTVYSGFNCTIASGQRHSRMSRKQSFDVSELTSHINMLAFLFRAIFIMKPLI